MNNRQNRLLEGRFGNSHVITHTRRTILTKEFRASQSNSIVSGLSLFVTYWSGERDVTLKISFCSLESRSDFLKIESLKLKITSKANILNKCFSYFCIYDRRKVKYMRTTLKRSTLFLNKRGVHVCVCVYVPLDDKGGLRESSFK